MSPEFFQSNCAGGTLSESIASEFDFLAFEIFGISTEEADGKDVVVVGVLAKLEAAIVEPKSSFEGPPAEAMGVRMAPPPKC